MEVSGQLHAPAALSSEEKPPYPLDRRPCGPQRQCGCGNDVKMVLPNVWKIHILRITSELEQAESNLWRLTKKQQNLLSDGPHAAPLCVFKRKQTLDG
jgi:hypothetical protein